MPKINYDADVKILSVRLSKNKIVDSDMKDNCVIDYDKDGNIVNIDLMGVNLENLLKASS
ncbi:MAG: DUF2283 domain-containing protein [Candidatus Gracilibacteria bacterium]|nr:DUF2283 domain-containing protein [Candidatus Gracilibacteria bacterium]